MITNRPIKSEFKPDFTHPRGSKVIFIEALTNNQWLVEFIIPDETLVSGHWYDTVSVDKNDLFLTLQEERSIEIMLARRTRKYSIWNKFVEWTKEAICQIWY